MPGVEDLRQNVRVGVHWGDVVVSDPDDIHPNGDISGNAANLAARVEAACGGAGVMVSDAVKGRFEGQFGESQTRFRFAKVRSANLKGFPSSTVS